ncbi:MAG: hypothetical protein RRY95_05540 [Oscillospiraceae bacterium]
MSLEAVEKVTEAERVNRERKAAAVQEGKKIVSDAQQQGTARLKQIQQEAAAAGKEQLREAETRAGVRAEAIRKQAEQDGARLRDAAKSKLDSAAEFIVRRVVEG